MSWIKDVIEIVIALGLVALNGFFVAAEFALVKVRLSRIQEFVHEQRPFAKTARWLAERLDGSLSACQLGITMASLALGWVGEPAFAHLLEPVFQWLGVESQVLLHSLAFVIAFTAITALHLVIGEQAPKIYAIRRADQMLLWCAVPLKCFYLLMHHKERLLVAGDRIDITDDLTAEVLELRDDRADRVRVTRAGRAPAAEPPVASEPDKSVVDHLPDDRSQG